VRPVALFSGKHIAVFPELVLPFIDVFEKE
jgi:hypothetical protein